MSIWVKICGNTSLADTQLAVEAGADAVGFVFAPSPREVTPQQVAAMTAKLPSVIERIGVFVEADFAKIAATVEQCGLTGVQLHSKGEAALASMLRGKFGSNLRILQVLHFGPDAHAQMQAFEDYLDIDAILVDSRTATAVGGTGLTFDWESASRTVFSDTRQLKLIAAGGLSPENVGQAIALLHPWGVDVVSGVEHSPGRKDPQKVLAFITNARAAGR